MQVREIEARNDGGWHELSAVVTSEEPSRVVRRTGERRDAPGPT